MQCGYFNVAGLSMRREVIVGDGDLIEHAVELATSAAMTTSQIADDDRRFLCWLEDIRPITLSPRQQQRCRKIIAKYGEW